jgi:hypothetical protein
MVKNVPALPERERRSLNTLRKKLHFLANIEGEKIHTSTRLAAFDDSALELTLSADAHTVIFTQANCFQHLIFR